MQLFRAWSFALFELALPGLHLLQGRDVCNADDLKEAIKLAILYKPQDARSNSNMAAVWIFIRILGLMF